MSHVSNKWHHCMVRSLCWNCLVDLIGSDLYSLYPLMNRYYHRPSMLFTVNIIFFNRSTLGDLILQNIVLNIKWNMRIDLKNAGYFSVMQSSCGMLDIFYNATPILCNSIRGGEFTHVINCLISPNNVVGLSPPQRNYLGSWIYQINIFQIHK